jgi:transcriptional regulator with XRE-family HTH domain
MVRLPLTPAEVERGQRLGALLRRARGERSMLETALDARVSPETLRKIESGRVATPAFPTIAAIADVLSLSLDDVWAEINQPLTRPRERRAAVTRRSQHEAEHGPDPGKSHRLPASAGGV